MYKFALPIVAGMVSTAALLPQLWLLYRTKSAEDLSYNFLYAVLVAKMLWFVHAILDSSHIFAWTCSSSSKTLRYSPLSCT
jgi:uncharacterized protein with PQ loop repeat